MVSATKIRKNATIFFAHRNEPPGIERKLFLLETTFAQNAAKRLYKNFEQMGIGGPRTRSDLRWSFQWKEFVINHNDFKPFSEVIKIETEFLKLKCVKKGYTQFFFQKDRFYNVKVLEKSRDNDI